MWLLAAGQVRSLDQRHSAWLRVRMEEQLPGSCSPAPFLLDSSQLALFPSRRQQFLHFFSASGDCSSSLQMAQLRQSLFISKACSVQALWAIGLPLGPWRRMMLHLIYESVYFLWALWPSIIHTDLFKQGWHKKVPWRLRVLDWSMGLWWNNLFV